MRETSLTQFTAFEIWIFCKYFYVIASPVLRSRYRILDPQKLSTFLTSVFDFLKIYIFFKCKMQLNDKRMAGLFENFPAEQ